MKTKIIIMLLLYNFLLLTTKVESQEGMGYCYENQRETEWGLPYILSFESIDFRSYIENGVLDDTLYFDSSLFFSNDLNYLIKRIGDDYKYIIFGRNQDTLLHYDNRWVDLCFRDEPWFNWIDSNLMITTTHWSNDKKKEILVRQIDFLNFYYDPPYDSYITHQKSFVRGGNLFGFYDDKILFSLSGENIADYESNFLAINKNTKFHLFPHKIIIDKINSEISDLDYKISIKNIEYCRNDKLFLRKRDSSSISKWIYTIGDTLYTYNDFKGYTWPLNNIGIYKDALYNLHYEKRKTVFSKDSIMLCYSLYKMSPKGIYKLFELPYLDVPGIYHGRFNIFSYIIDKYLIIRYLVETPCELCWNEIDKFETYCILFYDLEKEQFIKSPVIKIKE